MLLLETSPAAQACLVLVMVASNVPPTLVDVKHIACNNHHHEFAQACKVDP